MKKIFIVILVLVMMFSISACSNTQTEQNIPEDSKILIAYFSREDENYGVGYIEKGNTQIIAEMIAEENGGIIFEIERTTPYPSTYDDCTAEARREQSENARPELNATVDDFSSYDVIYLGYPIWYGDMPMAVYTFLESYDFSGKTVLPFCTHGGSGLSNTVSSIKSKLSSATVLSGLAIRGTDAQNNRDMAKNEVLEWLK